MASEAQWPAGTSVKVVGESGVSPSSISVSGASGSVGSSGVSLLPAELPLPPETTVEVFSASWSSLVAGSSGTSGSSGSSTPPRDTSTVSWSTRSSVSEELPT